ncbi:MAG: Flp family type IVb pilin [Candidatus Viridilinea halotolerans]|uniref:Flp family type IVb pilin n=1 Tax=Candidatus Viridilinea halotolerans TaxID=2491704 RepID=A0A426TWZ1_9CHLR|nr:MAG: Flp family type IVb pilin [Candidatus Viridilinea halotolerans]
MAWLFVVRSRAPAQGLTEYGLVLVLIAITAVGILTLTGRTLSQVWYQNLVERMP